MLHTPEQRQSRGLSIHCKTHRPVLNKACDLAGEGALREIVYRTQRYSGIAWQGRALAAEKKDIGLLIFSNSSSGWRHISMDFAVHLPHPHVICKYLSGRSLLRYRF
jgi:hypothetical protein